MSAARRFFGTDSNTRNHSADYPEKEMRKCCGDGEVCVRWKLWKTGCC